MKKQLLTFVILFGIPALSFTQAFEKVYRGTFVDPGYTAKQTNDGGYIIASSAAAYGAGNGDAYLVKTNASGDTLWTKTYGGTDIDYARSVQQTFDGGFIVAGLARSFGGGDPDIYLIKTNSIGDTLWTKTYGGTTTDEAYSILQTNDGGYIFVGHTVSFGAGLADVYLIRVDGSGNILWSSTYGGADSEIAYSIQKTNDGGYIITGNTASFGAGITDVFLIKTDFMGNMQWHETYGGTGQDEGRSVQQTHDGGFIITGFTNSFGAGADDVYLIKTDSIGGLLWSKTFGGSDVDRSYSVQQTSNNEYIICGGTRSFGAGDEDIYLIETDSSGTIISTKTYGNNFPDIGYSIEHTNNGGYVIAGITYNFTHSIYFIKTDSSFTSGCNNNNTPTITTSPSTLFADATSSTMVSVPATFVNNTLTQIGGGGSLATPCIPTSADNQSENNFFNISPNPSTGIVSIVTANNIEHGFIEIYNMLGKIVIQENILNESKKEVMLQNISSGIYFVRVHDGEKYYRKKIVIEQD